MARLSRGGAALVLAMAMALCLSTEAAPRPPPRRPPPRHVAPTTAPTSGPVIGGDPIAYRLISITKWNATADLEALQTAEMTSVLACHQYLIRALYGISTANRDDDTFGNHLKVFDYASTDHYRNFSACIGKQPGRTISLPWEQWKSRALYPYYGNPMDAWGGALIIAELYNTTDRAATKAALEQITEEVSCLLAVDQVGETVYGVVNGQSDVALGISTKKLQGALAIQAYVNAAGDAGLAPLDTLTKLLTSGITSGRKIHLAPTLLPLV